jgi:putative ATPase
MNSTSKSLTPPLAERVRPKTIDAFFGQHHIVSKNTLLHATLSGGQLFSLIFWGPPGCGKTSLARLVARSFDIDLHEISAVSSGVKDLRFIIDVAKENRAKNKATLLFIDEIHRFNKSQQDALLHAVEEGLIHLFGATTENPSFEIISPLLSRCRVLKLEALSNEALSKILRQAIQDDILLSAQNIELSPEMESFLIELSGGDARKLLNGFEASIQLAMAQNIDPIKIDETHIKEAFQKKNILYDKAGDYHYDAISAFIKSVRGSDPDAALYWLAVMLEGGEDGLFIARRLIISASEDIGNADPQALIMATSAYQAVHSIGMPEATIVLAQVTTYLASTSKSNKSYEGIRKAQQAVREGSAPNVPLHLRNASTKLMKAQGYGKGYEYPHNQPNHFVSQNYFPDKMSPIKFYAPSQEGLEQHIYKRLVKLWPNRYQ